MPRTRRFLIPVKRSSWDMVPSIPARKRYRSRNSGDSSYARRRATRTALSSYLRERPLWPRFVGHVFFREQPRQVLFEKNAKCQSSWLRVVSGACPAGHKVISFSLFIVNSVRVSVILLPFALDRGNDFNAKSFRPPAVLVTAIEGVGQGFLRFQAKLRSGFDERD